MMPPLYLYLSPHTPYLPPLSATCTTQPCSVQHRYTFSVYYMCDRSQTIATECYYGVIAGSEMAFYLGFIWAFTKKLPFFRVGVPLIVRVFYRNNIIYFLLRISEKVLQNRVQWRLFELHSMPCCSAEITRYPCCKEDWAYLLF